MHKYFIVIWLGALMSGCMKNDPIIPPQENPGSAKGVYILNEGGFTRSNSSLTLFVPDSHKVYSDVFYGSNGRSIGDVANDMVIFEKKGFIVVNNSHKIEVLSMENHKSLGTLHVPGNSPNKIVIVSSTKGYISNLFKGTVTSFNPTTLEIIKDSIKVGNNPQSLAYLNGMVYVCNSGYGFDSTVSVIDVGTDKVIATIIVGIGPTDIGIDSKEDIFVRCTGYMDWSDPSKDTPGEISIIDPANNKVKATIPFPLELYGHPSKMAVTKKGYGFVIVKNGIAKFETFSNTVVQPKFSDKSGYTIAYDELGDILYVTDAKDFVQNGTVYGIEKNGVTTDSAVVGIVPGTIVFKN